MIYCFADNSHLNSCALRSSINFPKIEHLRRNIFLYYNDVPSPTLMEVSRRYGSIYKWGPGIRLGAGFRFLLQYMRFFQDRASAWIASMTTT